MRICGEQRTVNGEGAEIARSVISTKRRDLRLGRSASLLKRKHPGFLRCSRNHSCQRHLNQAFGPVTRQDEFEHFGVLFAPTETLDQVQPVDQLKRAQA